MGPLVRCYVGIRIPDTFWPKIQEVQMMIRRKSATDVTRWAGQNEMQLMLCGLGEQPWDMVKRATSVLGAICAKYPPLNLRLEGLAGIPNNNQPRYVAVNAGGDIEKLCYLREEIARALAPMLPPNEKTFTPQVTLGRLKMESEQARSGLGRAVRMTPPEVLGEWTADAIEILRADANSAGVQYQSVERFPLGVGSPAATPPR